VGVILISVVAVATVAVLVLILTWRRRRVRTPADRYQRDVRSIRLATYTQANPRYTRQSGNPELGFNASGGVGLGGGFGI
jgi:hypothetical protein